MDQLWQKVIGLDLKSVRGKFAARKSWWWHLFRSPDQIENEYRQFLFLKAGNPEKPVVPWSDDVDAFWRQHVQDTGKYSADCNTIAGRLIQYGSRSVKGSSKYIHERGETRSLYLASFGESARKRRHAEGDNWPGADTIMVFSDNSVDASSVHHGHHAAGHHHDAGTPAASHHGGVHSCAGHSGHSCGGHSSCGGHGH